MVSRLIKVFGFIILIGLVSQTVTTDANASPAAAGSIYWGATLYGKPPDSVNFQPGGLYYKFEQDIARKGMSIIAWGAPWEYPTGTMLRFQTGYFENVRQHGSLPMLHWGSWSCCGSIQPKYTLSNITRGDFDSFLRQWATDAKAWGYPFFVRFNWEMNGYWQFPWSVQLNQNTPAQFIAAWKHVHDIFRQVGATNATWVWCPNISSSRTTLMAQVYPGHDYVDWLCLDGYNQFTRGAMPWLSFTQVFKGAPSLVSNAKDSYQEITAISSSKPLLIGETGTIEAGDGGVKKGQWMTQMLADIPTQFPRIKAFVYFNWNDNDPGLTWPIESSAQSKNAFGTAIQANVYARNTFQSLPKYTKIVPVPAPAVLRVDSIGVYKAGKFYLRNSNTPGNADITAIFGGDTSDLPVAGDWNGDGIDTIGVYRNNTGAFYLSDSNTNPSAHHILLLGNPGDTPFAGRWKTSMTHDGLGVFRPANGILYAKADLTSGYADYFAVFGNVNDVAFAGDWNADGLDSVGVYRPGIQRWYMSNNSEPIGVIFGDTSFGWDIGTNIPVVGDWDGDQTATSGAYASITGIFNLSNSSPAPATLLTFAFGPTGSKPISGKWIAGTTAPTPPDVIVRATAIFQTENLTDTGRMD